MHTFKCHAVWLSIGVDVVASALSRFVAINSDNRRPQHFYANGTRSKRDENQCNGHVIIAILAECLNLIVSRAYGENRCASVPAQECVKTSHR